MQQHNFLYTNKNIAELSYIIITSCVCALMVTLWFPWSICSVVYSISQEICTRFCCVGFVVVMQSFIMNSHEVFIHTHQGCFAGTGAIVRLPQCQWSKPDGYGKISQCITTTKHSKTKTVCIFLGIYCKQDGWDRMVVSEGIQEKQLDWNQF